MKNNDNNLIPINWVKTNLKTVSLIITKGSTPTSYNFSYKKTGIKFIKTESINQIGSINDFTDYIDQETNLFLKRSILKFKDILFSIAGTIGRVGIVLEKDLPANTNQALAIIRLPWDLIVNKYAYYYFKSNTIQKTALFSIVGVGRANISLANIGDFEFLLPSINEQYRIVDKIEELFTKLDAGVAALEKVKAQLKRYRQAVLKAAFSGELTVDWRMKHSCGVGAGSSRPSDSFARKAQDSTISEGATTTPFGGQTNLIRQDRRIVCTAAPLRKGDLPDLPACAVNTADRSTCAGNTADRPAGWEWIELEKVSEINPKTIKNISDEFEVSFLPMRAVEAETGKYNLSIIKNFGEVKKGFTQFQNGDLIFAKITPCMENGKIAIADNMKNEIGFGSTEFHVIRTKKEKLQNTFLFYFIAQKSIRKDARQKMTGTAGQLRVPVTYLKKLFLPVPSIKEQHQIVAEIERRFSVADQVGKTVDNALKQAQRLRQSILKRAFEGKLVPQDPNDEPAEMLLNRIKEEKQKLGKKGKK